MTKAARFEMLWPSEEERAALRALAEERRQSQAKVVRDLVREAVVARRAAQSERWGPRLFGTEEPPNEAA